MISFVLLNWNSRGFVQRCVQSLREQTDSRWELILVDNGSTNNSVDYLATLMRTGVARQLIRLPENRGYAAGMNVGIAASSGKLIVPLNSDVYLGRNFVGAMHEAARDENVGMWAAPVYKWDWGNGHDNLSERLDTVGVSVVRRLSTCTWHPELDDSDALFGPPSCAPVLSRVAVNAAARAAGHVFDERYVSYGEDLDLFIRLQSLGFKCAPCLETAVWHIGSASYNGRLRFEQKPRDVQALVLRNRLRNYQKIAGWSKMLTLLPWVLTEDLFRTAAGTSREIGAHVLRCYREAWSQRGEPSYSPFPIRFGGNVLSRSAWVRRRGGELPALQAPHPDREVLLGTAA